jgi:hypothetical protein
MFSSFSFSSFSLPFSCLFLVIVIFLNFSFSSSLVSFFAFFSSISFDIKRGLLILLSSYNI